MSKFREPGGTAPGALPLTSAGSRIAVVTGASRGVGRGIALALGDAGMTVYVTGRSTEGHPSGEPGTVDETAAEVTRRGGRGIPVACDHDDDDQVEALFERVRADHGHLDILVNNVLAVPDHLTDDAPFWELPAGLDVMFRVGLRSTYVASRLAAPLLIARSDRHPLLVTTSGFGGGCYLHGPAYGAVKAGVDKMAHDMAVDLRPFGVTAVSLWMGLVRTERTLRVLASADGYRGPKRITESPEFTGRVIAALDRDPDKLRFTGRVLVGAELGALLDVTDVDGTRPASRRLLLGDPPRYSDAAIH
ncbi:SDR family NAD(P)-dependent oxidoreductase [Herbiconiux sp. P17]|uniref:SDR family NAD(P)-dependent oxidoreductase n=1 Tax=Herbiconiux wuyangfengii TaxID=3342794 RepID=UPI0035B81675